VGGICFSLPREKDLSARTSGGWCGAAAHVTRPLIHRLALHFSCSCRVSSAALQKSSAGSDTFSVSGNDLNSPIKLLTFKFKPKVISLVFYEIWKLLVWLQEITQHNSDRVGRNEYIEKAYCSLYALKRFQI